MEGKHPAKYILSRCWQLHRLRREGILIEPGTDTTGCKKIGEEITEVLEYEPGELYVKQYRRAKCAKPRNGGVVIGPLPSRPLEKAMAGEGLLAQIITDKFINHLPLHRQMQRFERSGVKLAYFTLTDWVSGTCRLIAPLFEALKAEVLQSSYLHVDETPIKVMDKDKKGETHRGYYWVYQNSLAKTVLFDVSVRPTHVYLLDKKVYGSGVQYWGSSLLT